MFSVLFQYDPYSQDTILDLSKDRRPVFILLPQNRGEAVVRWAVKCEHLDDTGGELDIYRS